MNTELVSSDAPSEEVVFNKLGECEPGAPRTGEDTDLVSSDSPSEGVVFNQLDEDERVAKLDAGDCLYTDGWASSSNDPSLPPSVCTDKE